MVNACHVSDGKKEQKKRKKKKKRRKYFTLYYILYFCHIQIAMYNKISFFFRGAVGSHRAAPEDQIFNSAFG